MPLKVMLSSVRRGLADARDAIAPVLVIMGYTCVRFEAVTQQPVPPRAVCVQMVEDCDIYLLLLGEEYGEPMPGTDLAPTAEEWTVARNLGKPVVVFKKTGIRPEPRQTGFIREVEAYESGVWRGTFSDTPDLLGRLKPALTAAAATLQPLAPRRLTAPVDVPWRELDRFSQIGGRSVLETHVLAIGEVEPLPAAGFDDTGRLLARAGRDHGLFEEGQALEFPTTPMSVSVKAERDGRRPEACITVSRERTITISEELPGRLGGSVLDEEVMRTRVARDIRLAAGIGIVNSEDAALAIGLDRTDMLGVATGPTTMTYPYFGRTGPVRVEPSESVPTRALATGAAEVATELVACLLLELREQR